MSHPSPQLRNMFQMLEMAAYQEWKDATPERREEITRELARYEAKLLIEEIAAEVSKLYPQ